MEKKSSRKKGLGGSYYESLDYELDPNQIPGIPIIFPRKEQPKPSVNIESVIKRCEGVPMWYCPESLYERSAAQKDKDK